MRLPELLDIAMLRKLTEANHAASGMPTGIVDALDGSVLVGFGWQDACVRFHRGEEEAIGRCRRPDCAGATCLSSGGPCEYTCENGFRDIGVPILVAGEHLATLFLGQFFYEGEIPHREVFRDRARTFGLEEEPFLAAIERVPVFSREAVRNVVQYNEALARFISEMAERALALARHEQALRESEAWFRSILETLPHMVFAGGDGRNEYSNARLEQYTGMTSEELRGDGWTKAIHPDDAIRAVEAWSQAGESGQPFSVAQRIRRHDGEYRWFLAAASPLRDPSGRILRWIGTWTDIHDRIKAQEALLEVDRRKDEFLAVLSHELRNPLAPIRNAYAILERTDGGSEQAARARAVIGRQTDHLTRLVDDLLDLTRISRGKVRLTRARVDLGETVRKTAEDLRSIFASRELVLDLRAPAGPIYVEGDAMRLSQVVGNLLANAAKFTDQGGHVSVCVERSSGDALVHVRDDGLGIAPEMLRELFQPFTQADRTLHRTRGGLGLGLALVKRIVELHGGSVSARSEGEGKGAQFTIALPVVAEAERAAARAPRPAAPETRRILVIEDNEDAAVTLRDLLELDGHEVHLASDGEAGLEAAHRLSPDVILCDIGLPGVDGYEVARRLRSSSEASHTTLVALTGYASPADSQRAAGAGFDHHLSKPPDLQKLARILVCPRAGHAVS